MNDIATIKRYHEATKHHFRRYARSLGYLDWATQPDPFRRFTGAELISFPLGQQAGGSGHGEHTPANDAFPDDIPYEDIFRPGKHPPRPLRRETIGKFLEYSLGISAWKRAGSTRWALRINPSSGNLHPTEGYCLLPAIDGIHAVPGVYHYAPREHGLERRGEFPRTAWDTLPPNCFLVGLSSIAWREAWKYGERAFRYCQHDCGHAYMALDVAARLLGWRVGLVDTVSDRALAALLGLDRAGDFRTNEEETPEMLIAVHFTEPGPGPEPPPRMMIPEGFVQGVAGGAWFGKADPLSRAHHEWPSIRVADRATRKPATPEAPPVPRIPHEDGSVDNGQDHYGQGFSARQVVKKRRSAVAMDGTSSLDREAFYRMLGRIVASGENFPWSPQVHLALFVHRVDDLPPGLYLLVRHPPARAELEKATHRRFRWEGPPARPAGLPLYLLQEGDFTDIAKTLGCAQDIAGDGAFGVGMIARFQSSLDIHGAWFYKRLFWETGMIGQLLYLEAEAVGLSGCGIGCFFDDAVHELLGLRDQAFQSLYHFTVGGAVNDPRVEQEMAGTGL